MAISGVSASATSATSATNATNSTYATSATNSLNSTYATSATSALNSTNSTYATSDMKNVKLKICGMKEIKNIKEISTLNPDYLGFIFWEKSKRNMTLDSIPELHETTKKVGVFVDASIQEIATKINQYQLDIIQLHGNESVIFCKNVKKLGVEVIKVFSMASTFNFSLVKEYVLAVDYFLFDTKGKLPGGNGVTFDWKILENYHYDTPNFLS